MCVGLKTFRNICSIRRKKTTVLGALLFHTHTTFSFAKESTGSGLNVVLGTQTSHSGSYYTMREQKTVVGIFEPHVPLSSSQFMLAHGSFSTATEREREREREKEYERDGSISRIRNSRLSGPWEK